MHHSMTELELKRLPKHFPEVAIEERHQDWAKEYFIATQFAQELDYYRALTFFKRARMLADQDDINNIMQIEYATLFTYYLASKPKSVVEEFEKSTLRSAIQANWAAFDDLLIILHDVYKQTHDDHKAEEAIKLLEMQGNESAQHIKVFDALNNADWLALKDAKKQAPYEKDLDYFSSSYHKRKKSMRTAAILSMIIPGSGYLYVDQKRSFITSLMLNAAFIGATYGFFKNGHNAAGIITLGFELGWYFGGIYGSQMAVKHYNERLYKDQAESIASRYDLFPSMQLRGSF